MTSNLGEEDDMFQLEQLNELYYIEELRSPDFEFPDLFGPDPPPLDDSAEACEAFLKLINDYEEEQQNASPSIPQMDIPLNVDFPSLLQIDRQPPISAPKEEGPVVDPGPDSIANIVPDGGLPELALGLTLSNGATQPSLEIPQASIASTRAAGMSVRARGANRREARAATAYQISPSSSDAPSTSGAVVDTMNNRRPKLRYSKGAAPSKYCHVCGRSSKTVSVALCGNNSVGLCRKVVCDKCLLMHQRDSWEMAKQPGSDWICMHCKSECPDRARCHQYQRNNLKRRLNGNGEIARNTTIARPVKIPRTTRVAKAGARTAKMQGEGGDVDVLRSGGTSGTERIEDISPVNVLQTVGTFAGNVEGNGIAGNSNADQLERRGKGKLENGDGKTKEMDGQQFEV